MSKFKRAAISAKPDDNARDVLSVAFVSTAQPKQISDGSAPLSNRAAKRVSVVGRSLFLTRSLRRHKQSRMVDRKI